MTTPVQPPTPHARRDFLPNLQVARFLAAFVVMYGHLQYETRDLGIMERGWLVDFNPFFYPGGVDIFFVISGFIMYYLGHRRFGEPGYAREFLRRRIIRIVPLYWLFLALMLATMAFLGDRLSHAQASPAHILTSFAFIPWPRFDGNIVPILSSGWTLNYEMLFYAAFTIALLFPRRIALAGLAGFFLLLAALHPLIPRDAFMAFFWTRPIILEFLMGIGLAMLYLRGLRISIGAGLAVTALGFVLFSAAHLLELREILPRFMAIGLPAAVICAGLVLMRGVEGNGRGYRALVIGGDASYSLYLSHPFTLNLLAIVWERAGLANPYLYFVTALALCILVSVAIYRWFEDPVIRHLNARFATRVKMERAKQF